MASSPTSRGKIRLLPGFGPADTRILKADLTGRGSARTFQEIGRTGLRHMGGFVYEEWQHELQGRRGAEIYREMGDSWPVAAGLLFAVDTLCRRASWHFEAGGDTRPDEEAREFAEQCLFEDMSHSWPDTVSEILTFLQYGWSWFEIVWKRRGGDTRNPQTRSKFQDGRVGIRKLASRSQDSLWEWVFDEEGGVQAMTQNPPPDYALRTIPIDKSLLFRTRTVKNNPEGWSILRPIYRSYYMWRELIALLGIGIERDLAGLPMITPPQNVDIWDGNDLATQSIRAAAEKLVSGVRRDEQEGILKPYGWEFELLSTGGRRQFDIVAVLDYLDKRAASTVLADVILIGQQNVGSYALADSKEGMFYASLDTFLDHIAGVVNQHLIPRLFKLNGFTGLTDYPRLVHGPVARLDIKTLTEGLQALAASGAPIWPNDDLLETVYEEWGLPAPAPDDGLPPVEPPGKPDGPEEAAPAPAGEGTEKPLPQQANEGTGGTDVQ